MRKILTQAQKTFTDLYDSYVLNLSSDIVAVPCDHEGKTTENCTANITYSVNVGTQTLTATCQALSEIENVDCSITSGQITITVPQEVQLADDASMGFRFTTTDSNQFTFDRYITFIKMQKGANGENARSFQIKSEQGDTFNEGIDSITMTAVAFDGATEITDATYTWFYYVSGNGWVQILDNSNGTEDEAQAIPFTQPSLTVYRTATYANSVFRCVITYADGEHDEDYYQLKTAHYNYESVVKFFGGTSTISASSDPFVIAYVDLYKDFQKEETVEADYYYYHENNIKTSSGIDIYTKGIDSTYNTDGNLIYAIYKDETVSPSDTPDSYTISASASPLEYGEVTGGGTYEYGSNIILTATPKSGYIFDKWLDNNSTDATRNITVTQGASYTASFSVHKSTSYTITAKSNDSDHGSGYVNGKTGSQTCDAGSVVTLSAYANVGYVFDDWYENGIAKHWPQSINITTTSNRTFIAHFRKVNVTESMADIDDIDVGENKNIYIYKNDKTYLLFQPTTSGTYRFHCEDKSEMNTYLYNSDMELLATDTGYEFEIIYSFIAHQMYYFAVDINEYEYNSNSVDVYLEDTGASGQYAINLTMSAGGSSVTGAGLYEAGTMVLITATAKNGYEFIRWESSYGETLSTTSSYSFQVNYDMSLTAIFQPIANSGEETSSYGINVSIHPNELCGTVTGTGIYEAGNSVTLSATANSGYEFQGWYINNNGALEGVSNSSTYTFQATQTITYLAVFQDKHHEITVEWFGNGAVYIEGQSDGNGITESLNTKSGNFKENSVIRIVAVPEDNHQISNWYLDGISQGTTQREFSTYVTKTHNIIVQFEQVIEEDEEEYFTINIGVSPSEAGYITGATTGSYKSGTPIMFEAVANDGYTFSSWGDGTTSTMRLITVSRDATYIAYFTTSSSGGSGGGSEETIEIITDEYVRVYQNGVNITNSSYIYQFNVGDQVRLVANNPGYTLNYWHNGDFMPGENTTTLEFIASADTAGTYQTTWTSGTSAYAMSPMMMRSAAPMTLTLEDDGIAAYDADNDNNTQRAKYKAVLCQYTTGSGWSILNETSNYIYHNDLYEDVKSKVIVISKEDVSNYKSIGVTIYKKVIDGNNIVYDNNLVVSNTSFTVFDLNDPILSNKTPSSAKEGQLWLDTSKHPYVLYIYQGGKWEYFNQQAGKTIYTTEPTTYTAGDIWILDRDQHGYGKGTMLTAIATVTVPGGFNITHWTDANPNTTNVISSIVESFSRDDNGIKIAQKIKYTSGKVESPFYVHIDSQRMGFHSVVDGVDDEVVHIGNSSAEILNATFKGDHGTKFENAASFYNQVNILNEKNDGTTSGFAFQTEDNGSFSLILVGN